MGPFDWPRFHLSRVILGGPGVVVRLLGVKLNYSISVFNNIYSGEFSVHFYTPCVTVTVRD